jgi:hypothetical protein
MSARRQLTLPPRADQNVLVPGGRRDGSNFPLARSDSPPRIGLPRRRSRQSLSGRRGAMLTTRRGYRRVTPSPDRVVRSRTSDVPDAAATCVTAGGRSTATPSIAPATTAASTFGQGGGRYESADRDPEHECANRCHQAVPPFGSPQCQASTRAAVHAAVAAQARTRRTAGIAHAMCAKCNGHRRFHCRPAPCLTAAPPSGGNFYPPV